MLYGTFSANNVHFTQPIRILSQQILFCFSFFFSYSCDESDRVMERVFEVSQSHRLIRTSWLWSNAVCLVNGIGCSESNSLHEGSVCDTRRNHKCALETVPLTSEEFAFIR